MADNLLDCITLPQSDDIIAHHKYLKIEMRTACHDASFGNIKSWFKTFKYVRVRPYNQVSCEGSSGERVTRQPNVL